MSTQFIWNENPLSADFVAKFLDVKMLLKDMNASGVQIVLVLQKTKIQHQYDSIITLCDLENWQDIFKREQPIRLTLLEITFLFFVVVFDLSNLYYKRLDKDIKLIILTILMILNDFEPV